MVEAFVMRYKRKILAYRNVCRHAAIPLDWTPNEFFDETGDYLLCRTHGALYEPKTGMCIGGPCTGQALHEVPIRVGPLGSIFLNENE